VEVEAPAPTPDPLVVVRQAREVAPCVGVKRLRCKVHGPEATQCRTFRVRVPHTRKFWRERSHAKDRVADVALLPRASIRKCIQSRVVGQLDDVGWRERSRAW
jgi:hypothetical protein